MLESASSSPNTPELRQTVAAGGGRRVELSGAWNLAALGQRLPQLRPRLAKYALDVSCSWDLSAVTTLDHAGALLLWRVWGRRRAPQLILKPEHESLFADFAKPRELPPSPLDWWATTIALGQQVIRLLDHVFGATALLGRVMIDAAGLVRRPSKIPWREFSANIFRTGAKALGITAIVGFLVGVVISYLSAQQLKQFGADIYIVNLVGVSVIRELGPVLAAVLIAGRSGSAMTAQLGVMRVTEELDAMTVMGIPHTVRLVLPRMIALAISMPLLVLWTDIIAILGGMLAAKAELNISYRFFLSRLPEVVPIANLWLGLGKSVVFGALIALIACHFGLRIKPDTESLGAGTTQSVVIAITTVIIVDAIFAVMFSDVGVFK
ncbi:MAG: ABC transporter permease [Betaproteobacteria bacterium]|nr:ABC transporter permease [Betaproteobacteria bacterium]MDH3438450.1 ABC transporter permease [Betaproteobacteria bacterium]